MELKILEGLDPVLVQHPGDRAVLSKLEKAKLASSAVSKVVDFQVRQSELDLLGGGLHVTSKNMPDVFKMFGETCEVLGIKRVPELYLGELPVANAFAVGADKAYINITSELFFRLNEPEIRFMFGHELGHIICGHTKYKMLVRLMTGLGYSIMPGPLQVIVGPILGAINSVSFKPLMMLWSRRSEYSADRAGLLACQSLDAAAEFFMKICGLPLNYYGKVDPMSIFEQAEDFQRTMDKSLLDTVLAGSAIFNSSHPRAIDRVAELKRWIDDGMYDEILDGTMETRESIAKMLRSDPADVELVQSWQQTLTSWASKEFSVEKSVVAPKIRQVLLSKNGDFKGSPMSGVFSICARIVPEGDDDVRYEIEIKYGKDGTPFKTVLDVLVYPHQLKRSYLSDALSRELIANGGKPIVLELYKMVAK